MKIQFELPFTDTEKRLCSFLPCIIFCLYVVNLASCVSELTGISSSFVSLLSKAFLFFCIIINLPTLINRIDDKILIIGMLVLSICAANIMFFPKTNSFFISVVISFCTTAFPTMFLVYIVRDAKQLLRDLIIVSRIISLITFPVVAFLLLRSSGAVFNEGNYSMGFGYACALPTIFLLKNFIETRKVYDLAGVTVMLFTIFTFGSRGPLLSIAVFFALFGSRYLITRKEYGLLAFVILLLIPICMFYKDMLAGLAVILAQNGIESRTLELFLREEMYTSGRDALYASLIDIILKDPLSIRGICSEWLVVGVYAHNLALELIYQFGVIVGGTLVLIILGCAISTFFFTPMNEDGYLEIIFACMSLTHLMFSSSLWTNYIFWAWIAVFLRRKTLNARNSLSAHQSKKGYSHEETESYC